MSVSHTVDTKVPSWAIIMYAYWCASLGDSVTLNRYWLLKVKGQKRFLLHINLEKLEIEKIDIFILCDQQSKTQRYRMYNMKERKAGNPHTWKAQKQQMFCPLALKMSKMTYYPVIHIAANIFSVCWLIEWLIISALNHHHFTCINTKLVTLVITLVD